MSIFGLILLGVGGFALYKFISAGKARQDTKNLPKKATITALTASGDKTVLGLAINDIFQHTGQDFMVEGKLIYREGGDEWWEYRLVDGADEAYLSVEDDDELEVALWREIQFDVPSSGPPESLVWEGDKYRCAERGEASVTRDGKTGRKSGLTCKYWDYEGPGGKMVGIEQWGGGYEVWSGEELEEGRYDILPGDLIED